MYQMYQILLNMCESLVLQLYTKIIFRLFDNIQSLYKKK